MFTPRALSLLAIFWLSAIAVPRAFAEDICKGELSRLFVYAGSYDTDAILNDPVVATELRRLLGTEVDHLLENLSVRGSADLESCDLVIEGNADHRGGEENGIVAINLVSGTVAAGLFSGGRVTLYAVGDDYFSVPISIKDWIAVVVVEFNYRFEPPATTQLLLTKPPGQRPAAAQP